jgi:hypothetical protein
MSDDGRRTTDKGRRTEDERRVASFGSGALPYGLDLQIEELVLHGFPVAERYRIGAAVEAELARLFAERGVPPLLAQGGEVGYLDGGSFSAAPGLRAEVVGGQVARALYGGLDR